MEKKTKKWVFIKIRIMFNSGRKVGRADKRST
jgi:hypothetical protein